MKQIFKGFLHVAIWYLGMFFTIQLMHDSDARNAYGYIVGWWGALYCGYVLNIRISAAIVPFGIHFLIGVFAVLFKWSWLFKGVPTFSIQYIILLLIGSTVFVSPIFVNAIVRKIKDKLINRDVSLLK